MGEAGGCWLELPGDGGRSRVACEPTPGATLRQCIVGALEQVGEEGEALDNMQVFLQLEASEPLKRVWRGRFYRPLEEAEVGALVGIHLFRSFDGSRDFLVEYPSVDGYTRLHLELELDVPLRQLVPDILALLRRSDGIPNPDIEVCEDESLDWTGYAVYFQVSEHRQRMEVGVSELDKCLGEFGIPPYSVMYIDAADGCSGGGPRLKPEPSPRPSPTPTPSPADGESLVDVVGEPREPVQVAATAPREVARGRVQAEAVLVACFVEACRDLVEEELRLADPARQEFDSELPAGWAIGSRVMVILAGDLVVGGFACHEFAWDGDCEFACFDLDATKGQLRDRETLRLMVRVEGFEVLTANLDIGLVDGEPADARVTTSFSCLRRAFASYASRDRDRVLDRVSAVAIATGMEVFMDCLHIRTSERWKDALADRIASAQVFMLFWSRHAARSDWVDWEWRTALERLGSRAIQVHPLEPVELAPPPRELAQLHFGDAHLAHHGAGTSTGSLPKGLALAGVLFLFVVAMLLAGFVGWLVG